MKFAATLKFLGLAFLLSAHVVLAKQHQQQSSSSSSLTKSMLKSRAFVPKNIAKINNNDALENASVLPRGGACSDTNPVLFLKIGTTSLFEAAGLFGVLYASILAAASPSYPEWIPEILNQTLATLLASMLVIFGSSFVGAIVEGGMSVATKQVLTPNKVLGDPNWYANLQKPSWNPPGWAFPIMWLIVSKPTQLCALSRIIKYGLESDKSASLLALVVYATHLALGDAWNKVFFGLECIERGTFVISLFYGVLLASTYLFYNIDKGAGLYMLPTCAWVTVATALQYSIYFKNK